MTITRRNLGILSAATATMAVAVSACSGKDSSGSSGGDAGITFAGWVPGIEDAVELWNSKNPDAKVTFTRIASADAKNLPSQIKAGTAPDVAQLSASALPSFVIDGDVQDITEHVKDVEGGFSKPVWSQVTFAEKVYGIPQDTSPNALMYRKDLFDQHGITVPTTWDEYVAAARALRAAAPDAYIAQFSPNEVGFFQVDQLQAGDSWFGTDGDAWTIGIDGPKSASVTARWQELLDEDLVKVEQMWTPEYWTDVNSGVITSMNYAAWFPVLLEENAPDLSGKWAVVPSPSDSGTGPSADLGGSVNVVTKNAKNPEQAAKFISWLNTDPASLEILIGKGGLFPASSAGFETTALKATSDYWGGVSVSDVFVEAAKNVSDASSAGPEYSAAAAALGDEFAKVATKTETFAQALTNTAKTTRAALEQKGLAVK